ncbi:hypothetical protein Btru_057945 [Bulinus truncatus]|nr:hypothetical protein Btru_057945 [Bulinus truncatus]
MESQTSEMVDSLIKNISQVNENETEEYLQSLYKGKTLAKNYANYRPEYPKKIYEEIMSYHNEVSTNGHQLAVDVCCGTGLSTLPLVPLFDKVVGVDVSEDMMEYMPKDIPNLKALVCPAEKMTMIGSGTVDLVTIASGLHWTDIDKFLQEVKRILKPSGTFAAYTWQTERIENEAAFEFSVKFVSKYKDFMTSKIIMPYEKFQSVKFPFQDLRRFEMEIPGEWTIEQYKGYMRSMHFEPMYNDANPGTDSLEEFGNGMKAILNPKGDKNQDVRFKCTNTKARLDPRSSTATSAFLNIFICGTQHLHPT